MRVIGNRKGRRGWKGGWGYRDQGPTPHSRVGGLCPSMSFLPLLHGLWPSCRVLNAEGPRSAGGPWPWP